MRTDVNACDCTRGCTDTVRESALKVDSRRKIPCRTGESNLRRQRAGPTPLQLIYISTISVLTYTATALSLSPCRQNRSSIYRSVQIVCGHTKVYEPDSRFLPSSNNTLTSLKHELSSARIASLPVVLRSGSITYCQHTAGVRFQSSISIMHSSAEGCKACQQRMPPLGDSPLV